jgi:hypothetical protein
MNLSNPLAYMPSLRKKIYSAFWVTGLVIGAAQVGLAAADEASPVVLDALLAIYAFLGGAIGFTAAQNVDPVADEDFADDSEIDEA